MSGPQLDIDSIEAAAEKATPGPWLAKNADAIAGDGRAVAVAQDWDNERETRDNVAFIAAARTDVPALCAEVRQLRQALAKVEKLRDYYADPELTDSVSRKKVVALIAVALGAAVTPTPQDEPDLTQGMFASNAELLDAIVEDRQGWVDTVEEYDEMIGELQRLCEGQQTVSVASIAAIFPSFPPVTSTPATEAREPWCRCDGTQHFPHHDTPPSGLQRATEQQPGDRKQVIYPATALLFVDGERRIVDTYPKVDKLQAGALYRIAAAGSDTPADQPEPCPTLCDVDCDEPCHEVHQVRQKWDHDPATCPGRPVLADQGEPK